MRFFFPSCQRDEDPRFPPFVGRTPFPFFFKPNVRERNTFSPLSAVRFRNELSSLLLPSEITEMGPSHGGSPLNGHSTLKCFQFFPLCRRYVRRLLSASPFPATSRGFPFSLCSLAPASPEDSGSPGDVKRVPYGGFSRSRLS